MAQVVPESNSTDNGEQISVTNTTNTNSNELHHILSTFDTRINKMMDYPAKDIINELTMLAEKTKYASEIVSFLETKIHRVAPNFKLPIFYLTDSILKNIKGPYPSLFGRNIVNLFCNCVGQVSRKDASRFMHTLRTWETIGLFPIDAMAQMRHAANRALEQGQINPKSNPVPQYDEQDTQLRRLLTKLQNEMGIHPTEHMSLEEVRRNNPSYYAQLLDYQQSEREEQENSSRAILPTPPPTAALNTSRNTPYNDYPTSGNAAVDPRRQAKFATNSVVPAQPSHPANYTEREPSANAKHLMSLLTKRKRNPTVPPQTDYTMHEVKDENTTAPTTAAPKASAVKEILERLRAVSTTKTASTNVQPTREVTPPLQPQAQSMFVPPLPRMPPSQPDTAASRMWFSDKIVAHKDRVESNIQKIYAALPLVCRESGFRFKAQEKLNAHLDFLFQYNCAQKEREKGGISRSWYLRDDQWIADASSQVNVPREKTSSSYFDQKQAAEDMQANNDARQNAELNEARVPVDESIKRCRICGESFAKVWDEEEEDWMYTNAVKGIVYSDDSEEFTTIFHRYCYDAVLAQSSRVTKKNLISTGEPLGSNMGNNNNSRVENKDYQDINHDDYIVKKEEVMEEIQDESDSEDSDDDDKHDIKRIKAE